jgi:hypothetical protein
MLSSLCQVSQMCSHVEHRREIKTRMSMVCHPQLYKRTTPAPKHEKHNIPNIQSAFKKQLWPTNVRVSLAFIIACCPFCAGSRTCVHMLDTGAGLKTHESIVCHPPTYKRTIPAQNIKNLRSCAKTVILYNIYLMKLDKKIKRSPYT